MLTGHTSNWVNSMKKNKLFSRRFLAALWSIIISTYIIVAGKTEFSSVLPILIAIVMVWIGAESYTKGKLHQEIDTDVEHGI